jgi:hypothetical protein
LRTNATKRSKHFEGFFDAIRRESNPPAAAPPPPLCESGLLDAAFAVWEKCPTVSRLSKPTRKKTLLSTSDGNYGNRDGNDGNHEGNDGNRDGNQK